MERSLRMYGASVVSHWCIHDHKYCIVLSRCTTGEQDLTSHDSRLLGE
jgi:hypothetical protein